MAYVAPGTVAAGDVATAAAWNVLTNDVIAHQASLTRLAFQTRATNYSITATTAAAAAEVFTDASWTADGTSTYVVECWCGSSINSSTASYNYYLSLCKGDGTELQNFSTNLGVIGSFPQGLFRFYYTPAAGTQTVNVRGYKESGGPDGTLEIASGTRRAVGATAFIAVYGPVTT